MEIILGLIVLCIVGYVLYNRLNRENDNGNHPLDSITKPVPPPESTPAWHTAPPEGTKPVELHNPLDVNHDGKVDMQDVKEAVKKVRARTKKTEESSKKPAKQIASKTAAAKKPRGRKPASK